MANKKTEIIARLRKNPNKWLKVAEGYVTKNSASSAIGWILRQTPGCQIRYRENEETGTWEVWGFLTDVTRNGRQ